MSTSTNAVLFFGFEIGDELPDGAGDPDYGYHEWNDDWVATRGPKQPERTGDYSGPEWDAWREARQKWESEGDGVEIDSHCSDSYPIYYVALTAHHHTSYRGDKTEVTPEMLVVRDDQKQALRDYCEKYGIEHKEPKWWLVSYWG